MKTPTNNRKHELGELEAELGRQLHGRVRELRLVLRGSRLVLRGHAQTYYAKQLVQHRVMEATALSVLANEIEVP